MKPDGVSFLITVYNKEQYLEATLASLHDQIGDFAREYVFIDDGSTDNSLKLLKKLTKDWTYSVKIIEQENTGPAQATNNAFAGTKYAYVKLVDADDLLHRETTQKLYETMRQNDKIVYAFGACNFEGENPETSHEAPMAADVEIFEKPVFETVKNQISVPSATMVKADAFETSGGCDLNVFEQDASIALRMSILGYYAKVKATVAWAPPAGADDGRLSEDLKRNLHGANNSLYHFLMESGHVVPKAARRLAAKKACGRTWKYLRRQKEASIFSGIFLDFMLTRTPLIALFNEVNLIKRARDRMC